MQGSARLKARPTSGGVGGVAGAEIYSSGIHKLERIDGTGIPGGSIETVAGKIPKLLVPRNLKSPAPLMVLLHGAGGNNCSMLSLVAEQAEENGVVVLAPVSRAQTWDMISRYDGNFGADIHHMDRLLLHVFAHVAVDPRRVSIAGFSDGASYALSVGVANPDLFRSIIAFSPGFMRSAADSPGYHGYDCGRVSLPAVYISHGRSDSVLNIDRCSRRLAPELKRQGYSVKYTEFEGGHCVPPDMLREGMSVLLAPPM